MEERREYAKKEMESLFNLNARKIAVEVAEKNLKLQKMEFLLKDEEKEIEGVKSVYELKLKELKFKEILEEKERKFTVAMVEKNYQIEKMKDNGRTFEISIREMKEELNKIHFDKKMESEGSQMPLYGLLMGGLSLVLPFQDSSTSKLVLGVITCLFSGFLLGILQCIQNCQKICQVEECPVTKKCTTQGRNQIVSSN